MAFCSLPPFAENLIQFVNILGSLFTASILGFSWALFIEK